MGEGRWVAISYTLPREPSRARVAVWRKLKKIGAVGIQQSMWVLPAGGGGRALLDGIKDEVGRNGGEAFVLTFDADADGDRTITAKLNAARDEEYTELLEQCAAFFRELERETARQNFSFAEIEENEEELLKLRQWYEKIRARDAFGAPLRQQAESVLADCGEALEVFCDKVYAFSVDGEAT